jgi:hypothetical protein
MANHPTKRVRVGDQSADIDVLIAPLIREIWKAGIETFMSCQGDDRDPIWLQFSGPQLEKFLNIVGAGDAHNAGLRGRADQTCSTGAWHYATDVSDWHDPDTLSEMKSTDPEFYDAAVNCLPYFNVMISVEIPKADLPGVLTRLREHNRLDRKYARKSQETRRAPAPQA